MKRILQAALLAATLGTGATAQDGPVVVELFTSQGCSSCPPADAYLATLGGREDVIPLSLHVDYWDYIGWADRFADPAFSARQRGYAVSGGWRKIYTPQIVVDGMLAAVGSRTEAVEAAIARAAAEPDRVAVEAERAGGIVRVSLRALRGPVGAMDLHIVRYSDTERTDVRRGENAGRVLTNTHIVRDWDVAARWNGTDPFDTRIPVPGDAPLVVLVQAPDHGPILAAMRLR